MKKSMITFALGVGIGLFYNTESGKKLRSWVLNKGQEYKDILVNKINEVTSDNSSTPSDEKEEEKDK